MQWGLREWAGLSHSAGFYVHARFRILGYGTVPCLILKFLKFLTVRNFESSSAGTVIVIMSQAIALIDLFLWDFNSEV